MVNQQELATTHDSLVIDLGDKKCVWSTYIYLTLNALVILSGTNDSPRSIGSVEESAFPSKNLGEVSKRVREKKPFGNATISTIELTLRLQYVREIWKRDNQRPFWICVWENLEQGNHVIIVTSPFLKALFSKRFPFTRRRKAGVFKSLRFAECFGKAPFS